MKESIKDKIKKIVFCLCCAVILIYSGYELYAHVNEFYVGLIPITIVLLMMIAFCVMGIKDIICPDSLLEDCSLIPDELWDKIKYIIEEEHPEIFEQYKNKDKNYINEDQ